MYAELERILSEAPIL